MKKIKKEDLMKYLYNDCPPELTNAINQAIKEDAELKDELELLKRSVQQLDQLKLKSPSKKSIKAIMQYASKSVKKD